MIYPFVNDVSKLNRLLRQHGAVISGSVALRFFLPEETWDPEDMDIYVPDCTFDRFFTAITDPSGLNFKLIPRKDKQQRAVESDTENDDAEHTQDPPGPLNITALCLIRSPLGDEVPHAGEYVAETSTDSVASVSDLEWRSDDSATDESHDDPTYLTDTDSGGSHSDSLGDSNDLELEDTDSDTSMSEENHIPSFRDDRVDVYSFRAPSGKVVDIIRSPTDNPVVAINRFWSSLVMNFLLPDAYVCGFPTTTLSRIAMLKPDLAPHDDKAVAKYALRNFEMTTTRWRDGVDFWDTLFFGRPKAMVYPFHLHPCDPHPSIPITHTDRGWLIDTLWPRALRT